MKLALPLLIASAVGLGAASALAQTAPGDQTIPEKDQSRPLEPRNGGVSDPGAREGAREKEDVVSVTSWTKGEGSSSRRSEWTLESSHPPPFLIQIQPRLFHLLARLAGRLAQNRNSNFARAAGGDGDSPCARVLDVDV
jgi:hypothetical protein